MDNRKSSPGMANTFLLLLRMPKEAYQTIMTIEHSPLKNFDPMVAHMLFQVLAFVWSAIFALMLGSYLAFGVSATLHVLFVAGVFVTALVYKEGNRRRDATRLSNYNGRMNGGEHE